jgi:hypothetical protein
VAHDTAPVLSGYFEVASFITNGSSKAVNVTWSPGDFIVVLGGGQDVQTLGVPTATGLTFASIANNNAVNTCSTRGATATAAGSGSAVAVTMTNSVAANVFGFSVWVFSGHSGVGTIVEQHTATRTANLTPVDTHSAIVWCAFDFAAAAVVAGVPTPTNTREATQNNPNYTAYEFDIPDQPGGGAVGYGVGGSGVGPFSIIAVEVQGTTTGAAAQPSAFHTRRMPLGC